MDVVFPQYYEWHTEMERIAKILDASMNPDIVEPLYKKAGCAFRALRKLYNEGGIHGGIIGESVQATVRRIGALQQIVADAKKSPIDFFALIAYLRALCGSHDLTTRRVGEQITTFFLYALYREGQKDFEGVMSD